MRSDTTDHECWTYIHSCLERWVRRTIRECDETSAFIGSVNIYARAYCILMTASLFALCRSLLFASCELHEGPKKEHSIWKWKSPETRNIWQASNLCERRGWKWKNTQTDRQSLGVTAADSLHLLVNILLQLKLWLVRLLHLPVLQFPERRGGRHQFPF